MSSPYTLGDTRPRLTAQDAAAALAAGHLVLNSTRRRPLWFDGRFLAARDLANEQNYFLKRQADLARAAGFGTIHGLNVSIPTGASADAETVLISAGHGVTPSGELVMLPDDLTVRLSDLAEEQKLDRSFGLPRIPVSPARTRSGLYVLALRLVEFTANAITSYPTTIDGNSGTHDGDTVEATALALVPWPDSASGLQPTQRRAALAQQIFLQQSASTLASGLLPLALISLQRGTIEWVDQYLVRRDLGPTSDALRLGLTDPATQRAFLLQYDAMLQETLAARAASGISPAIAATDFFRALPPAGRFPLASIDTTAFTQVFFPQQMDVRLSVIPEDELPALIDESLSLPPIDLTLPDDAYSSLAVFALVPVPRTGFAALKASLPQVPLTTTVPRVLSFRQPIELLRLFNGSAALTAPTPTQNNDWKTAIGQQTYGYYLRRRSAPVFVDFATAQA